MKNVLKKIDTKFNIMKKLLMVLCFLNLTSCKNDELFTNHLNNIEPIEVDCSIDTTSIDTTSMVEYYIDNKDLLIEAMIWVESRDNDSAVGDGGRAVGCLQIHPIMVREANRILKLQKSSISYNLLDRWDREKSIEIFYIVNNYHNKSKSYEAIARSWNGGPNWIEKSNTKKYWRKVKRKLKKLYRQNEYSPNRFAEV